MNTLLLISIGVAITGQAKLPDWPPLPEEGEHVDYIMWYHDARRAGMKPEDDGFPLYREAFPTMYDPNGERPARLLFSGFRTGRRSVPVGYPKPWNPRSHPDWEASFQRTNETVRLLRIAAARPYFFSPEDFGSNPRILIAYQIPIMSELRRTLKGMSEGIWRVEAGRVNVDAFIDYVRTAMRATRQIERDPMLIAQLVAVAIRAMVYEDIRHGLHHQIFSPKEKLRLRELLLVEDSPVPPLDRAMRCECAVALDVMQFAFEHGDGGDEDTLGPIRSAIRSGELDRELGAEEIMFFFKTMAEAIKTMGQQRSTSLIVSIRAALDSEESNAVLSVATASYVRATVLRDRVISGRSATRLIISLHIFRDQSGSWPNSLDELPADVISRFKIDAVSRKPFVYKQENGQPLLYSLGENAIDDGGCHDPHYGERAPRSDFVYWPANGGYREPMVRTSRWPRIN